MEAAAVAAGYNIAERMGLDLDINRIGYHLREMRIVDERGGRVFQAMQQLTE